MALLTQKNVGGTTVTPALATKVENDLRFDNQYTTDPLATAGLPRIVFWTRFYGGDGVPSPTVSGVAQFQTAVRTLNGEPDFFTFTQIIVPPGSGISYSFDFPCIAIRLLFQAPRPGIETVRVNYSLNAYGA